MDLLVFILPYRFVLTDIGCLTCDVPRPLAHVVEVKLYVHRISPNSPTPAMPRTVQA